MALLRQITEQKTEWEYTHEHEHGDNKTKLTLEPVLRL